MKRYYLTIGCLLAGAVLIIAGLKQGQAMTVLSKATRICLECVGIG